MAKKTIKLKNYLHIMEEYTATAVAITPGMLIEVTSAGLVQAHSTAGGNAIPMFAVEDELQGNAIGDNYAASAKVQCWIPQRGDQVFAILKDGENVAIGDFLESDGAGALVKHVADTVDESWDASSAQEANTIDLTVLPLQIVGQALEAVDLSGSSGEETDDDTIGYNKRIKIRIV